MTKFKKGDRVRLKVDRDGKLYAGHLGTVEEASSVPYVTWDHWYKGHSGYHDDYSTSSWAILEKDLEPVFPSYSKGDRVRVVGGQDNAYVGLLDSVGTVVLNDGSSMPLRVEFEGFTRGLGLEANQWWLYLKDVEPEGNVKPYQADPVEPVEFKAGDLAVYTYAADGDCYILITGTGKDGQGRPAYKAKFLMNDNTHYVHTFEKKHFRQPTEAELKSNKFDWCKPVEPTLTKAEPMSNSMHIVVLMDRYGRLKPSTHPYQHTSRGMAQAEAKRLAETIKLSSGESFVVFTAVAQAVPPVPSSATIITL